jgi:regulator of sigma E protease
MPAKLGPVSWLLTLLGIAALIVLHELGHFTVAKWVGMRVERFSLFFPPTIARVRRGETEYAIGAIPAGGYVKITGMNPEEIKTLEPELARRAYYSQPPWKRIAVIAAGPAVNILIAFLIFWSVLAIGNVNAAGTLEALNPSIQTQVPTVGHVEARTAATGVLRPGDRLISVDGQPAAGQESTARLIDEHRCAGPLRAGCRAAVPVELKVLRSGHPRTLTVYPRYNETVKRMLVGFVFGSAAKHYGAGEAAGTAVREMWGTTTGMISSLGHAFTSEKVRHELHSIVGITEIAHESVLAGVGYALVFLGFISLVLAVINLFPFLPLDGGHILWALAEKVRGRRVSLAAMYRFSSVGIILLVFLVINGVSNDISRLAG